MDQHQQDPHSLDLSVDKRLELLSNGVELKLSKEIDVLFKNRFDTTIKILGWGFGVIAVILTGLGIKTFSDIRADVQEIARTTAREQIEKTLDLNNPNSTWRRDVDRVVAGEVINRYLFDFAKSRIQHLNIRDIYLSDNDLGRLVSLVTNANSDEKEFGDGLEVIMRSVQFQSSSALRQKIQSIANAQEEFKWAQEQPRKRAAVFKAFSMRRASINDLQSVGREVLTNDNQIPL